MSSIKVGKIIILIAGLLYHSITSGQSEHEFSVYGGGGLSALKYHTTAGDRKSGSGGLAGAGYHYFFIPAISIGTGIEFSLFRSSITINDLSDRYMTADFDGDEFEFRSTVSNYKERQNAILLTIPLMLQYQPGRFYISAGGKAGIPVRGRYRTSGTVMKNSGYYALEDYEYTTQEFLGFGTFAGKDMDDRINMKIVWMLSAEAGIKWKLKDNLFLYTGIYLDYGLNDMTKDDRTQRFVDYDRMAPADYTTNSIIVSRYTQNGQENGFTDKVVPLAAGIKVRLSFGWNKKPKDIPVSDPDPCISGKTEHQDALADGPLVCENEPVAIIEPDKPVELPVLEADKKDEAVAEKEKAKAEIGGVIFSYALNETELTPRQKEILDRKAILLDRYQDLLIICTGHTCDLGDDPVNNRFGLRRAGNVKEYLVEKGVDAGRITVTTKGKSEHVVPNNSEENRRINRRVEIIIL